MELVQKDCLLCDPPAPTEPMYERTFEERDLTPSVFSARRVTEHFHYKIVRCQGCGLVFSKEVLPDERTWALYSQSAFTFGKYTPVLRADYWRHIARFFRGQTSLGAALEVGCSSGFFLEELRARGFDRVVGVEPSKQARDAADTSVREAIKLSAFDGRKTFPEERFDLVCAFHTLDHLSDPESFLKSCREVLSDKGLVYVVVHDVESLQARLLKEKSPIIDIEHIYLFARRTLRRLLEQCGLEPLVVARFWNSYPLEYWAQMFPASHELKARANRFLRASGLGAKRVGIPAGNIYAVARVPQLNA